MIAFIAAVPLETEQLRRHLAPCEMLPLGGRELFSGRLLGHRILLLHSGVGKANGAAAAAVLLERHRPRAVILCGCGGAYPGSELEVGDLALATEEIYGDEGVATPEGFRGMETIGYPLVERKGLRLFNRFPVAGDLIAGSRAALAGAAATAGKKLLEGPFVTVSTCSGTGVAGRELARRTGGICENMEGAAVAQVCTCYGVPFLELRGISNLVEDRDLDRWDLKGAASLMQQGILALLEAWRGGERRA